MQRGSTVTIVADFVAITESLYCATTSPSVGTDVLSKIASVLAE